MNFHHTSVLLNECIDALTINPDGLYVDGTLGGGGHSLEICKRLSANGRLIGIDQDPAALAKASEVLSNFPNANLVRGNFSDVHQILLDFHIAEGQADGFLLDLGTSSFQLDEPSRGFSYQHDAPLDMRMNPDAATTAADIVNGFSAERLTKIISDFGEERWAKRIASFIVEERKTKPIETTFELVSVIKKAVPKGARTDGPHPAKRTFQAIRIEVNGELEILERALRDMVSFLKPGGRICVITFHSLEDRIVKNTFRSFENPCTCPPDFPVCVCGKKPCAKYITRKPVVPSENEIEQNPRARSAKLRVAEKI